MMSNKILFFILIPFVLLVVGCDRVTEDIKGDEMARFDAWIKVNNLSNYKTASGLYYISEREGTGVSPVDSDLIVYSCVIRNLDDFIYENTYKDTAKLYDIYGLYKTTTHYAPVVSMYLSKNTIPQGLSEGVGKMKAGGKARLIMPSSLAFGKSGTTPKSGSTPIGPYTSLIYDVELIRVFKGDFKEYEKSIIDDYLNDNPGFSLRSDSIYYKMITPGVDNGGVARDSIVTVNYTGRFLDGFIFETTNKAVAIDSSIYNASSSYLPIIFKIGYFKKFNEQEALLPSFHLAIKQMKEGEKAKFIIPSKYMYGAQEKEGTTNIPAYTPLIFEIELVKVTTK